MNELCSKLRAPEIVATGQEKALKTQPLNFMSALLAGRIFFSPFCCFSSDAVTCKVLIPPIFSSHIFIALCDHSQFADPFLFTTAL